MTEAEEQEMLFQWADIQSVKYPALRLMFHIPNEGKRSMAYAMKLKQRGVKPGVPDIFLPVPINDYAGLFIELKRADGGKLSTEQTFYLAELRKLGYQASVCYGFDEAAVRIKAYLEGDTNGL